MEYLSAAAIIFAVNVFSSILKRWIYPKYGKVGVQATVFFLAFIASLYVFYREKFPGMKEFVATVFIIFSFAVTAYEVILSHIPLFKNGKPKTIGEE